MPLQQRISCYACAAAALRRRCARGAGVPARVVPVQVEPSLRWASHGPSPLRICAQMRLSLLPRALNRFLQHRRRTRPKYRTPSSPVPSNYAFELHQRHTCSASLTRHRPPSQAHASHRSCTASVTCASRLRTSCADAVLFRISARSSYLKKKILSAFHSSAYVLLWRA